MMHNLAKNFTPGEFQCYHLPSASLLQILQSLVIFQVFSRRIIVEWDKLREEGDIDKRKGQNGNSDRASYHK